MLTDKLGDTDKQRLGSLGVCVLIKWNLTIFVIFICNVI